MAEEIMANFQGLQKAKRKAFQTVATSCEKTKAQIQEILDELERLQIGFKDLFEAIEKGTEKGRAKSSTELQVDDVALRVSNTRDLDAALSARGEDDALTGTGTKKQANLAQKDGSKCCNIF